MRSPQETIASEPFNKTVSLHLHEHKQFMPTVHTNMGVEIEPLIQ